jgi:hypothetical protein
MVINIQIIPFKNKARFCLWGTAKFEERTYILYYMFSISENKLIENNSNEKTDRFRNQSKNIARRMKLDCMILGPDMWQDRDENGHIIRNMKNQHIENSLRLFFRESKWNNRKYMIKCLYLEKLRRIRLGKWNLIGLKLGPIDTKYQEQFEKFLQEFNEI